MEQNKEVKRRGAGILAVLLLALAAVLCWRAYKSYVVTKPAEISPALPIITSSQEQDDPNLTHTYIPYIGTVVIEHDRSFMDPDRHDFDDSPTQLDTMDLEQIAAFRKDKVQQYAQLNFFHEGYDPFKPPHNKIYGQITPKVGWVAVVPYYIANPYILLSLTHANYVAPFTAFLDDVDIVYANGRITETHTGTNGALWHAFLDSKQGAIAVIMVNAWDAGFYYIHLVEGLSENIVPATAPDNVGRALYSQSSFYHVGPGKNNISPYDARGCITLQNNGSPTKLVFHLWRKRPSSVEATPDLIYEMIFKP
jgi:hypothetical protein